jgi:hypothetical protein
MPPFHFSVAEGDRGGVCGDLAIVPLFEPLKLCDKEFGEWGVYIFVIKIGLGGALR